MTVLPQLAPHPSGGGRPMLRPLAVGRRLRAVREQGAARILLVLVLCALAAAIPSAAQSQMLNLPVGKSGPESTDTPDDLAPLIEAARKDGARIIVIEPPAAAAEPPVDPGFDLTGVVLSYEDRINLLAAGASRQFDRLPAVLNDRWPGAPFWGPFVALLWSVAALAIGRAVEIGLRRVIDGHPRVPPPDAARGVRYAAILRSLAISAAGIVVHIGVATLLLLLSFPQGDPTRIVGYAVVLVGALYFRLGVAVVRHCLRSPADPPEILPIREEVAQRFRADMAMFVGSISLLLAIESFMGRVGVGRDLSLVFLLAMQVMCVSILVAVVWRNRHAIDTSGLSGLSALLGRFWPEIALGYVLTVTVYFAWVRITGEEGRLPVLVPVYAAIPALVIYALGTILLERNVLSGAASAAPAGGAPAAPPQQDATAGADTSAAPPAGGAAQRAVASAASPETAPDPRAPEMPGAVSASLPDATGAAAPVVRTDAGSADEAGESSLAIAGRASLGVVAVWSWVALMLYMWGVPLIDAQGSVHSFWLIVVILMIARIGWIVTRTYFDRRIAEERGPAGAHEPGDEGGLGGSRLGTLLPLFRTSVMVAVIVLTSMIVLSKLGVNIAPLFAGAGLIGFAIGFGAQSLVRDIFAGLFFLIDDAFRLGEYVEVGGLRGTVEKISIRSMQLRHHTGPVHTLPFGEIKELTNYSRDWVIMKLPLRVTFDTDPERVRKLVKTLGQELLADPVYGPKFLEPLKSQGVREIDDSGQIIRVKFMARPGDQFVLRKTVYARIRELFEREGIEFARREVRVRVTESDHELSDEERQQIAGAAAEGTLTPPPGTARAG